MIKQSLLIQSPVTFLLCCIISTVYHGKLLKKPFAFCLHHSWASLVAQMVKRLPAMWETRVQSLGWENPLEKETHSSTLAWKIPWTEEPGRLQSMGSQRVGHS